MSDPTTESPSPSPPPSPGSTLPYFFAIALLFAIAYGGFKWWQVQQFELHRGEAIPMGVVGPPLTEFELTERSGETFHSADMRGKVWVVSYFYCSCPGQCIRLNQNIKFMHKMPELKDVTWVSITCDPDNDNVEALTKYAETFEADPSRWLFCRAPLDYVKRVGAGMNLEVYRQGHKDYVTVIDRAGKIRALFDGTSKADCEKLYNKLVECLAETPPNGLAATPADTTAR